MTSEIIIGIVNNITFFPTYECISFTVTLNPSLVRIYESPHTSNTVATVSKPIVSSPLRMIEAFPVSEYSRVVSVISPLSVPTKIKPSGESEEL